MYILHNDFLRRQEIFPTYLIYVFKVHIGILRIYELYIHFIVGDYFSNRNFVRERRMRNSANKNSWFCLSTYWISLPVVSQEGTIWQYGLWSFQRGNTKLERFLPKNQHTQRKLLNFENWVNGEVSKIEHHFSK